MPAAAGVQADPRGWKVGTSETQLAVKMGCSFAQVEVADLAAGIVAARRLAAMWSAEAFAACSSCPKGSARAGTGCFGTSLVDHTPAAAADRIAAEVLVLSARLAGSGSCSRDSAAAAEVDSGTDSTSSARAPQIVISGFDSLVVAAGSLLFAVTTL